jgi:hypothetical protein
MIKSFKFNINQAAHSQNVVLTTHTPYRGHWLPYATNTPRAQCLSYQLTRPSSSTRHLLQQSFPASPHHETPYFFQETQFNADYASIRFYHNRAIYRDFADTNSGSKLRASYLEYIFQAS